MSTTTEDIIAQIDGEIAAKLAEVAKLQAARKALKGGVTGSNGTTPTPTPAPVARKARKSKERAPTGALEAAIEKVLKSKPGLTNGEVRDALKKDGYKWSLTPLHVGKRLVGGVDEKRWSVKLDGNLRRYYPAK